MSCKTDRVQWPDQVAGKRHSQLELGALASAVPCARLHVRHVLWEWGLSALTDDAALIVSELITNAVEASADGTVRFVTLTLAADAACLSIGVWDASPHMPEPQPHEIDSDSGRGFEIVTMLSASISIIPDQDGPGKTIWAHLRCQASP
jgi:anti-sigma regulatory factor (Ser/Thr protein kinase)